MSNKVDVVAVELGTSKILWVYPTDERNAEAVISMAVARQGCDDRFFTDVPHGLYKSGDKYADQERA